MCAASVGLSDQGVLGKFLRGAPFGITVIDSNQWVILHRKRRKAAKARLSHAVCYKLGLDAKADPTTRGTSSMIGVVTHLLLPPEAA